MAIKVDDSEIEELEKRKVEDNKPLNTIDDVDRGCFRIFSKIGKFIEEEFSK